MKKILLIALFVLCLLSVNVAALTFSPTGTLTLSNTDPGNTVTDSTSVDIVSTVNDTAQFSNGVLSQGSRSFNLVLPSNIPLTANTPADVSIRVTVPANQYAGTYTGNLVATSTITPSATQVVSLTVNSKPSVVVTPASFSVGQGLSKTVNNAFTITNNGNTDLSSIQVSVSSLTDGTNTLTASLGSTPASIPYGTSAINVAVTANAASTQPTGVYTGTISVNYAGASAPITSTITVTVRVPSHNVEVSGGEILAGSSTQVRNTTITKTFTVQNTGDYPETATLALEGAITSTKYAAQLSTSSVTLSSSGSSQNVQLTLTVPGDQDAGVQSLGNLKMTYNNGQITSVPLKLETKSILEITKIETEVGGDSADTNLGDGQTLGKEAEPGDEVELQITVKNNHDSSSGIDVQDVMITLTPADDDVFEEIELEDEFDITASNSKTKTLTFSVPEKINAGEYDFDLIIEGEDENGVSQTITYTITLEVEKEDNDVRITEATLGTSILKCARNTQLRVTIANFGAEDQDEAALAIFNTNLGINENVRDIFLDSDIDDSDNEFTKTIEINLADNFPAGTYPITIKAFRSTSKEMDQEIVNLKVESCPPQTPVEPEDNTTVIVTPTAPTTTSDVVETVEGVSFTNSNTFIWLLVGLNAIMLIVIVALVIKFLF